MGVLFPSFSVGHHVKRGKRQKEQQKALPEAHEHKGREASGRQTLVNQLNFIPEYKENIGLGSLETHPNFQ